MPVFTYTGTDAQGKRVSGEKLADSKVQVTMLLRRERITPGAIKEKGKEFVLPTFGTGKVPIKDLAIFFRQFSVMIDAGLPLVQCLEILAANQENQVFQKCLTGVRTSVAGGILDTILQRLATYVEKSVKLKSAVKSALIYPVSVITIACLVVGALLKFVVPIFANMFNSMGVDLPLPTAIVIKLSNFVGRFWYLILAAFILIMLAIRQVRR